MIVTRCAIYTRKSSEEGLDQAFNSLHAQREACEAYVRSQKGEGWKLIPTPYDDGGFSGGSMERPALRTLLADIAAGKVDVVVVYKIDRLTRSLMDFARMVELFDAHKVSFVSVTQAFNTTTSMGRLTLNVLLSFAQFEREVTGERIRDKIAASKAKGMWMGGQLPLGYDLPSDPATRALVVNEVEAEQVRLIFRLYLELGSVHALATWLASQQICSKAVTTSKGRQRGGLPFSRGALFHLLKNRVYLGLIVHGSKAYPGAHPAIIDEDVFEAVQSGLKLNARRHHERPNRVAEAPLKGRIFDVDGHPMSPSFAHGGRGQVYRYYVSAPLQQGGRLAEGAIRRVPAPVIETKLAQIIDRLCPANASDDPLNRLHRVEVHPTSLQLLLPIALLPAVKSRLGAGEEVAADASLLTCLRLVLPLRMRTRGGRTWITTPSQQTPATARRDPALIRVLRQAHEMLDSDSHGLPTMATSPVSPYHRRILQLALLAPELQLAILEGRQPAGLNIERVMAIATIPAWADQVQEFQVSRRHSRP